MKKIWVTALLFSTLVATAQRNKLSDDHENFFRFGVKGGVNANKITGAIL
ncbi:MAG: hypothetical protein WDM90_21625 [Ferruginibacter sp.]